MLSFLKPSKRGGEASSFFLDQEEASSELWILFACEDHALRWFTYDKHDIYIYLGGDYLLNYGWLLRFQEKDIDNHMP